MKKYKLLRFFANLFSVFFFIGTIVYIAISNSEEFASEKNVFAIHGIVCLALFVVCIVVSKKLKKKIIQPIEEAKQMKLKSVNAVFNAQLKYFYGLPIAQGVFADCYWCDDKVLFEASGVSFNLGRSKLTDISIKTDVEIQKSYVSSVGGAVAGGIMFGTLGAMIGGRAKERTTRQITKYLIFTYLDGEELEYIAFDCTFNVKQAEQFVNVFAQTKTNKVQSFDL